MAKSKNTNKESTVAHVSCPKCGARVFMIAVWESEKPKASEPYADIKALAVDEPKFWGGPTANRIIVKECYSHKSPVIHFRVNGQDRMAYLKGRKAIKRR